MYLNEISMQFYLSPRINFERVPSVKCYQHPFLDDTKSWTDKHDLLVKHSMFCDVQEFT
jgi:hypothetical protein